MRQGSRCFIAGKCPHRETTLLVGYLLWGEPAGNICASLIGATAVNKLPFAVTGFQTASALQGGKAASKVGQGYKFSSVGSRFKKQLQELMDALHQMEPHYIRCIKPNSQNRSARAACAHRVPRSTACCSSPSAGWPALPAPASSRY